jgi:hypothetical protein
MRNNSNWFDSPLAGVNALGHDNIYKNLRDIED